MRDLNRTGRLSNSRYGCGTVSRLVSLRDHKKSLELHTGTIPRVKSVGYRYLFVPSVFFKMFWSVLDTSGIEDPRASPTMGRASA